MTDLSNPYAPPASTFDNSAKGIVVRAWTFLGGSLVLSVGGIMMGAALHIGWLGAILFADL